MRFFISPELQSRIIAATRRAVADKGMVNVPLVAGNVHNGSLHENVALEDIERRVLEAAQMLRAAIEFDRSAEAGFIPGVGAIVTIVSE